MIHLEVTEKTKQYELYENVNYEDFWQGVQQRKLDELEQMLVRNMLHLPVNRLVDIGCGYGRLLDCYLSSCKEVILLDSSNSLMQQAFQRSNGKAICITCDLNKLPFIDSVVDQILMIRVFHHLDHPQEVLNEFNRVLVNQGHLLFSYCNKMNIERVFRWIFKKNPYHPFRYETAWVWNVFFMHHPRFVRDSLINAGFERINEKGAGVLDKLAGKLGKIGEYFPSGFNISPLLAKLAIAPWIFNDSKKSGSMTEISDLPFDKIIHCLRCNSSVSKENNGYLCKFCGEFFPIIDGVIQFL